MRIDVLWHVYTILFAHNLAAVHGEWYSVVVLYREGNAIMRRIHERMVRQAAHQHELALLRMLQQRLKKTRCVETLGLFEKSSSKYTTVPFCKFSCMSVEKRTI